jgi:hypothetical protein
MKQAVSTFATCCVLYGDFLLSLLVYPENGGDLFLRNVD